MTDPVTGAILWGQIAGLTAAAGAGVAAGSALSTDTPDLPDPSKAPPAPELPEPPTQAEAPGGGTKADYNVQRARDEERRRAGNRQGRSNTILTGSLGVQGPAPTARKSLLGE